MHGEGRFFSLSSFRGKLLLVNIWATWCPPCLKELPALDRLASDLSDDDLTILPTSIDEFGIDTVGRFFRKLGLRSLEIYLDPQRQLVYFNSEEKREDNLPVYGLPISFFVNRDNQLLGYITGAVDWDAAGPRTFVKHLKRSWHS